MKRDFLYLSGFLKDHSVDEALRFECEVHPGFQAAVLAIVGWESLDDSQGNAWELDADQIEKIATLIGHELPESLSVYVEALTTTE